MNIVILGQVPPKKNSKQLFMRGGRPMMVSSKAYLEWEKDALSQLKAFKGQADEKVTIAYQFYVKDLRARDLDNMIASVNDALIKAGLLKDDSWQWAAIGAADAELDRDNPRVELWIDA